MYELVNTAPCDVELTDTSEIFDECRKRSPPNEENVSLIKKQEAEETLNVVFSPQFHIVMISTNKGLDIYFCGRMNRIKFRSPSTIAEWIVRQLENYESYIGEYEDIADSVEKQAKTNRMTQLAIKATFSNAMKQYPNVRYEFFEQVKRMRIGITLPNGQKTMIYSYYATFRQRLHEQINELKKYIDSTSDSNTKQLNS